MRLNAHWYFVLSLLSANYWNKIRLYNFMSILNKLVDHGSKFILVLFGLAIALLPIIHIFANETLHHQGWNPAFEKY